MDTERQESPVVNVNFEGDQVQKYSALTKLSLKAKWEFAPGKAKISISVRFWGTYLSFLSPVTLLKLHITDIAEF